MEKKQYTGNVRKFGYKLVLCLICLVLLFGFCMPVHAAFVSNYYEQWRSQFHFSPRDYWSGDPNGLVFDPSNNTWHLFYQYRPTDDVVIDRVWGHAVSEDLVHWEELDIAITQDRLGDVFSGSVVVDEENTTGFFTDNKSGESKLVALYTSHGGDTSQGTEKQCIAYSKDHGVTWIRPDRQTHGFENPVIPNMQDQFSADFRDPKIFRYDNKWFMVIGGSRARLFVSYNLIDWIYSSDLGFASECPDMYPLAVDGDPNNIKWVFNAAGRWYTVGRLEKLSETKYNFVAEGRQLLYNGCDQIYATQSFYNDGSGSNRRIAISWITDHVSEDVLPGKGWYGAMTLPYEQTLRTVNGEIILCSTPVSEIENLYGDVEVKLDQPTVDDVSAVLKQNPCDMYEITIVAKPAADAKITFTLRQKGTTETIVVYDAAKQQVEVIRTNSSADPSILTEAMVQTLYIREDGSIKLHVLMDRSIIEVFGNDGEAACSGNIFPRKNTVNNDISIAGHVEIESFTFRNLTSIWHEAETESGSESNSNIESDTEIPVVSDTEQFDSDEIAGRDTITGDNQGCSSSFAGISMGMVTCAVAAVLFKRQRDD